MKVVSVTRKHIKEGTPEDQHSCAIALALSDAFKLDASRDHISVDDSSIEIVKNMEEARIEFSMNCPPRIARFIERFDNGKKVRPFKFALPIC